MNDIKAITDFLFIEDELENIRKSDLVLVLCNDSIKDICEKIHYLIEKGKVSGKIIISGCSGILDQDKDKECYRVCNMLCDEYIDNLYDKDIDNIILEYKEFKFKMIDFLNSYLLYILKCLKHMLIII